MQLIASDLLAEAHGLSAGLAASGLAVGFLLWLTGWWGHRFWIVLVVTALAGFLGLLSSPLHGMKPLAAGLLLAVAAGVLALALVRLVVFAAGGAACYLAVRAFAPPVWDEPLGWFLVGGLAGVLLFRLWTMVLTSGAGSLLMTYSALCLLDTLGRLDAVALAERKASLLSGVCLGLTAVGVLVQFVLERGRIARQREKEEEVRQLVEREQEKSAARGRWLKWGKDYRRAG